MAQPNALNPKYPGPVRAAAYTMPLPYGLALSTIVSCLAGTTRLPIFASTVDGSNGFSGTLVGVKAIGNGSTLGTISVRSDEGGTVKTITVAVGNVNGSMNGSACNTAFTLNGSSTVEASAAAVLASVEINFTVLDVN